jgi:hypothetical protein
MRFRIRPALFASLAFAALVVAAGSLPAADGAAAGDASASASAPPETIRWPSSVGEAVFPHRMHVEDLGLECDKCHHETVAPALAEPHPDYFKDFWVDCSSCHSGKAVATSTHRCATCHPERTASGQKVEMLTAKVAIHQSCWTCHEQGRGAAASAQCGSCHQRPARGASAAAASATK